MQLQKRITLANATRTEMKAGLYANILAKQERIKNGSGEKMRKPGDEGAPTAKDFKESAKTAKDKSERNHAK